MKKIISRLLVLTVLFSTIVFDPISAHAENNISVYVNGQQIEFPYAKPLISQDGRTMVPMRQALEAMGASVRFDNDTVYATKGDISISYKLGSDSISVTNNGAQKTVNLDSPTIVQDGSSLVPVRFFAEAFGLSVSWDNWNNSVIIMDFAKYFNDLASSSPALNTLLEMKMKEPTSYNYSGSETINLDISPSLPNEADLSSTGGSCTLTFNQTYSGKKCKETFNMSLDQQLISLITATMPADAAAKIKPLLSNIEFEMIIDQKDDDSATVYFRSDFFKSFLDAGGIHLGNDFSNSWIVISPETDQDSYNPALSGAYSNQKELSDTVKDLTNGKLNYKEALTKILSTTSFNLWSMKSYDNAFKIAGKICGSDNMTLTPSDSGSYTLNVDISKEDVENALSSIQTDDEITPSVSLKGTFTIKDGFTTSLDFLLGIGVPDVMSYTLNAKASYTNINSVNENITIPTQTINFQEFEKFMESLSGYNSLQPQE